jgi:hypothetical protein
MDQKETKQTNRPPIAAHIFAIPRDELLTELRRVYPAWHWQIGFRRLGDPHFKSEHPDYEIVSQLQPRHGDRRQRFAIYAKLVASQEVPA